MMELVRGCNLFEIRQAFGRIRWDVLQLIATEVLNTLGYIHSRGVVHRDISPCNVLASLSGEIKVSDLGLAKFVTDASSEPGWFRGKWQYAAPEWIRGGSYCRRSDLFSFAAMMYTLIT